MPYAIELRGLTALSVLAVLGFERREVGSGRRSNLRLPCLRHGSAEPAS